MSKLRNPRRRANLTDPTPSPPKLIRKFPLLILRASRACRLFPQPLLKLARCPDSLTVTLVDLTVYLVRSHGSIKTRSLPTLAHCFPRSFTFYVAHPIRSIQRNRL